MVHDRSNEFHKQFNRTLATKMAQMHNPPLKFHKTMKGKYTVELWTVTFWIFLARYKDFLRNYGRFRMPVEAGGLHFLT